jgi:hypothetical protein
MDGGLLLVGEGGVTPVGAGLLDEAAP